mgnify:CR=1 FL=1
MHEQREYMESNRALWDEWTGIHIRSPFYDVEGFKAGKLSLGRVEREGLGDVTGKRLLHLQCHFGMDTLSWARLGAQATGVDFSENAIAFARALSAELGIPATFICANIYDLPGVLSGEFDIVFTSGGVLYWLPDLARWGQIIAHFLKPGGVFYVVDAHPLACIFDNDDGVTELKVRYPYFHRPEPIRFEVQGSYADPEARVEHNVEYGWWHSMGEIVNALAGAGLRILELNEYPFIGWAMFPGMMEQGEDGLWRLKADKGDLPLTFALKATKD